MNIQKNDDAVSPVIGVILMVSITVIMAAVVAAFVFGMGMTVQRTYLVAATFHQIDADHILITYSGGKDVMYVTNLTVTIKDKYAGTIGASDGSILRVGCSTTFTPVGIGLPAHSFVRNTHVVATAHFIDGSSQVILDHFV